MDIQLWVKRYLDEGWSPIPIPAGEKGPRGSGWESKSYSPADFSAGMNVGVHLGRGLLDIDLDAKEAAVAADMLLPQTNRVSGRIGKPRSHRFYTVNPALPVVHHVPYYGVGGSSDTIVELRALSKNGSPTQTVIPPSLHPSGEQVAWDQDGKPFHCETQEQLDTLRTGVRNVAVAVLLARAFPGAGNRHNPRLAVAGFLFRAGVDPQDILQIGSVVMKLIGGDVRDWLDCARSTIAKLQADPGAQVVGGPTLKEMLQDGEQVLKRLNRTLGRTDEAAADDVIDRYNKHYCIVNLGAMTVVADTREDDRILLWPFDEFKRDHSKEFMPPERHEYTRGPKAGTSVMKRGQPQAQVWLEHEKGNKRGQLVYAPPGSMVTFNEQRDYNAWKGFALSKPAAQWPLIHRHLHQVICCADDLLYDWVMNWCAALVQQPGRHANTALVLKGGQGVGKGTFAHDLLGRFFHRRHYVQILNREQFYGRFNDLLSGKCLVFLDEATWGGDKKEAGVLKGRITSDTITIERKHLAAIDEHNMMHLILASNEDWPVGIDRDDRRFVVLQVDGRHANDPLYFKPLYDEIENGGREGLLTALQEWDLDERALRQPPRTAAKDELKEQSLAPEAEWWIERLKDGRALVNDKDWPKGGVRRDLLFAEYAQAMSNVGVNRKQSPERFGKMLKKFCPSLGKERLNRTGPRCYVLPTLNTARLEMSEYLKMTPDWEEERRLLDDVE